MNNIDNFMQLPSNFQNGIIQCTNIVLEQNIPDLVSILLFGSCARNEINVMSDIDIAIVTKDIIRDRSIRGSIRSDFEDLNNGLTADAVFTTVEKLSNSNELLYQDIRRDGIILWEDGEYIGDFKRLSVICEK